MGHNCNIRTELTALRAQLEQHFGGSVDCPHLKTAEEALNEHSCATKKDDVAQATMALERIYDATNILFSELSERDLPGTDHCLGILNTIHAEPTWLNSLRSA